MISKKQIFFLAGTLVVLIFLILRNQSQKVENISPNSNIDTGTPQNVVIIPAPTDKPSSNSTFEQKQITKYAKWQLQEKNLGLRGIELPKDGQKSVLTIEVKIKPYCTPGDADAIEMELKANSQNQLLATLEGMGSVKESFTWKIPKDLFTSGVAQQEFKISTTEKPLQYGFYLCTASSLDKTCQDKKLRDINEIFTEHLTKQTNLGQEKRIIFYQYLLFDERGVSFFEDVPRGEQKIKELKDYARERDFQGDKIEEGIDKASVGLQTLRSLPVQIDKNRLVLELPKYDPIACANFQKTQKSSEEK